MESVSAYILVEEENSYRRGSHVTVYLTTDVENVASRQVIVVRVALVVIVIVVGVVQIAYLH